MTNQEPKPPSDARMGQGAVARWENEGGAPALGREKHTLMHHVIKQMRKIKMRIVNYNEKDKNSGGTAEHAATDETMDKKFGNIQNAYEEGFAASDGVRAGTAETDGRVKHPEKGDNTNPKRTTNSIESQNPGLADN